VFRLLVGTVIVSSATALAVGWWLRRRRLAVRVAAAVAAGLGTACVVWASTVGLFLAALFEVWPLSLRQGPDTAFARECYAEFLQGPPPEGVTEIYCRREWGFGGDDVYSLRFTFRERSTVEEVVDRLDLLEVPESERGRRYLNGPGWWPQKDELWRARGVYQRRGIEFLWVDFESMDAFYQRANF
jgi:hypothetical protein